jgi:hypothetical protein
VPWCYVVGIPRLLLVLCATARLFGVHCAALHYVFVLLFLLSCNLRYQDEQEDKYSESRSRAHKVLKEQCPAPLLTLFSFSAPQPDVNSSGIPEQASGHSLTMTDVRKVCCAGSSSAGDTDYEGVLDLLRISMQLVPNKRLLPETLLRFALFRRPAQVLSAATIGGRSRLEFRSNKLTLTGGATADVTTLTAKVGSLQMIQDNVCFALYIGFLLFNCGDFAH